MIDFGAQGHNFKVILGETVKIVECFEFEILRVELTLKEWKEIESFAKNNFNNRLKKYNMKSDFKKPETLVDRLLGKELCILAWGGVKAFNNFSYEERWWIYNKIVENDKWKQTLFF